MQSDLFTPTQAKVSVRARSSDPDVSHEAAALLESKQEKLRRSIGVVLAILEQYGISSDFDIRAHWPEFWAESWSEHLPRMARLWAQREGRVVQAGFGNHKGRRCRTWQIGKGEPVRAELDRCPNCGRVWRLK